MSKKCQDYTNCMSMKIWEVVLGKNVKRCEKWYSGYLWHASLFYRNLVSAKWHGPQNLFLWTYLIKNHPLLFCILKLITSCYFHLFQSCYLIIFFCFIFVAGSWVSCLIVVNQISISDRWYRTEQNLVATGGTALAVSKHLSSELTGPLLCDIGRSHASWRSLSWLSGNTREQHTETRQNLSFVTSIA